MFKILAHLKKNWISVVFIILFLCLQAWADLTLPEYTSKIVDVGIQAGGIEYIAPQVIRKSQMDKLLEYTDDDNKILENYTLISSRTLGSLEEYNKKVDKYPALKNQELYELKKISKNQKEELDSLIEKPLIKLYFSQDIDYSGTLASQMAYQATKQEYIAIGVDVDIIQTRYILKTGLQMMGITLISMTFAITIMFLAARVAATLGKTLREKVFRRVLKFTRKEFNDFSTASLITRTTNDIQQIQMLTAMGFRVIVYAPIMGIGGFLKVLANSNNSMSWVIGLAIGAILFIISILFTVAMPKFKRLQDLIDRLNLVSREILTGLPVIRAFNKEKKEEERFDKANTNLMKTNLFITRAMSIMMPALMFVMNAIMLLIIWVGGHKVDEGIIQVGDMMAFIQYTMHICISFLFISMIAIFLPRATVSARRINEVLETEPGIKDKEETKEFDESKKGYVEFKDVSFRYPDADTEILEDISFVAKPR